MMKPDSPVFPWAAIAGLTVGLLAGLAAALARCDTLGGPVVAAARADASA